MDNFSILDVKVNIRGETFQNNLGVIKFTYLYFQRFKYKNIERFTYSKMQGGS